MTAKRAFMIGAGAALALAILQGGIVNAIALDVYSSDPDVAALQHQQEELKAQVDALSDELADARQVADTSLANDQLLQDQVNELDDRDVTACLAYSDRHYFREQMNGHGRFYHFMLVGWNRKVAGCGPAPKTKKHRLTTPKVRSTP